MDSGDGDGDFLIGTGLFTLNIVKMYPLDPFGSLTACTLEAMADSVWWLKWWFGQSPVGKSSNIIYKFTYGGWLQDPARVDS